MKSPPIQYPDSDAHRLTEEFITQNPRKSVRPQRASAE
jgi:hypothetical protein